MAIEEMLEKSDEEVNVDENVDGHVDGNVKENVDGIVDKGHEDREFRDRNVDVPPIAEPIEFMEEWEDGLGLKIQQEFASRKVVQEVLNRDACKKTFGFNVVKSEKKRLVLKCIKE